MGLLYPDHPDDDRPGLFEKNERSAARRNPRSADKRPTKRREEYSARVYDDAPVTNSTTSSELKSLNDLMVRPPTSRRDSDRPRRERDDFRDARRQERRERRERRERMARERTPSPRAKGNRSRESVEEESESTPPRTRPSTRPASSSPVKRDRGANDDERRMRRSSKAERPGYERSSTNESDRRRESASPRKTRRPRFNDQDATQESDRRRESSSPRKRRPSYADNRRHSSYDNRRSSRAEPERSRRRDSRSRYHSQAEHELIEAVPAPPPFTRTMTRDTASVSASEMAPIPPSQPQAANGADDLRPTWKSPLETILSESHSQHYPEPSASAAPPQQMPDKQATTSRDDPMKPKLDREGSFVSSYLEGSTLELGSPPPRAYRPAASDDSFSDSEYFPRRHSRRARDSAWDEVEYYKYGQAPEDEPPRRRRCCTCFGGWSRRRKWIVIGGSIAAAVLLIILIAVAATLAGNKYDYEPSDAKVTNAAAFQLGGATRDNPDDVTDGTATPVDEYTYYQGPASDFPDPSKWISFKDMWNGNLNTLQNSCEWLDVGKNSSPEMIQQIYDAIQSRANASLVDHRFIFATILQESNGCPRVGETKSSGGVRNPGLMQSHNGHVYTAKHSRLSILQMVQDGTQGTDHGDGIVQNLNLYGSPYKAARGYNSGYVPKDGNLSEKSGATKCYVSDIANRLTGWVTAKTKCEED